MHSDLDARKRARPPHSSFVIRVWHEGGEPPASLVDAAGGGGLRGSVQVVGRDSVRYFASLEDMTEIIAETVGVTGDGG